ncbi:uncharacterized protein [Nicotiana tomentosiformis]|uniref:uncharacterized protein n=1 Tax=Nicotiana tomentosiformis TaxID=4098 RepID=UPI00388C680E
MVVDAFRRKVESVGSLAFILAGERPLALDFLALANKFLRDTVQHGDSKEVTIDGNGLLRIQGQICVPNVDELRELILERGHSLRYFIHPGAVKMYRNLRKHYWWRRMKKDNVEYVAWCLKCY